MTNMLLAVAAIVVSTNTAEFRLHESKVVRSGPATNQVATIDAAMARTVVVPVALITEYVVCLPSGLYLYSVMVQEPLPVTLPPKWYSYEKTPAAITVVRANERRRGKVYPMAPDKPVEAVPKETD